MFVLSELLAAALRYRNAQSKLSELISDRINPILAIAINPVKEVQDNGFRAIAFPQY